jgi:hypothetical protein
MSREETAVNRRACGRFHADEFWVSKKPRDPGQITRAKHEDTHVVPIRSQELLHEPGCKCAGSIQPELKQTLLLGDQHQQVRVIVLRRVHASADGQILMASDGYCSSRSLGSGSMFASHGLSPLAR